MLVFAAPDAGKLRTVRERAERRGVPLAVYTREMFATGHDAANRAAVRAVATLRPGPRRRRAARAAPRRRRGAARAGAPLMSTVSTTLPVTWRSRSACTASPRLAPVALDSLLDAQAPVGHEAGEHGEVGAERLLAGGVDEEADQLARAAPRRWAKSKNASGVCGRPPATPYAVTVPRLRERVDRVGQHGAADAVEHQVERPGAVQRA